MSDTPTTPLDEIESERDEQKARANKAEAALAQALMELAAHADERVALRLRAEKAEAEAKALQSDLDSTVRAKYEVEKRSEEMAQALRCLLYVNMECRRPLIHRESALEMQRNAENAARTALAGKEKS